MHQQQTPGKADVPVLIGHTFRPLQWERTQTDLVVSGGTFRFIFSRANGLIRSLRILGKEWLSRQPTPDLWASPDVDPRGREWKAARETKADVRVVQESPERVVIAAEGRYLSADGRGLPLRYRLTYTIDCDGVVRCDVENRATGRGELRWLVFSATAVKRELVAFYSHIGDLALSESTGEWVTELMPSDSKSGVILSARFLPWLQLGNDQAGLDLVVDDGSELSHGWTDSEPKSDPLELAGRNFVLAADRTTVGWTYFAIRNLYTPLRDGWTRSNRCYLSPVPAKPYDPRLADLRVHWMGPHQIHPGFVYPTDGEIAVLARRGINLLIGCAHWRSGDYANPLEPEETRRVIAACHRHGIRILPYITFTDLDHPLTAFQEHGQEWQIEPVAEFRHLTNLMCYGAEGWREFWKGQVDAILDRFDFDGLYIDFWVGKMACRNHLHGCGIKYPRFTLPGVREMAWHAFRRVREKGPDRFILCNTNLFAGALINNLVDIRLPGEWAPIEETGEALARGHLNSRRLGCNALLLRRQVTPRSVSFFLRCQSPMVIGHGPADRALRGPEGAEPEGLLMRYADLLRFFGLSRSRFLGAWEDDGSLQHRQSGWTAWWARGDRGTLVVLANLCPEASEGRLRIAKPQALGLTQGKRYLVYRPDRGELETEAPVAASRVRGFELSLQPYEPALFLLTPAEGRPQALWATLSDGIEGERWQARGHRLTFVVKGAPGGRSRATVYLGDAQVMACRQGHRALSCRRRGPLAVLEVTCNEPVTMECG